MCPRLLVALKDLLRWVAGLGVMVAALAVGGIEGSQGGSAPAPPKAPGADSGGPGPGGDGANGPLTARSSGPGAARTLGAAPPPRGGLRDLLGLLRPCSEGITDLVPGTS